jgi:hypothetical protein
MFSPDEDRWEVIGILSGGISQVLGRQHQTQEEAMSSLNVINRHYIAQRTEVHLQYQVIKKIPFYARFPYIYNIEKLKVLTISFFCNTVLIISHTNSTGI